MRYVKITLAYDGSAYVGWQVQPNGPSVQDALEQALAKITGERIRVTASGRTDAGVHALGQVVSFATESRLPADELCRALNANTPRDIVIREIVEAPDGFHAIRDATGKRYRYVIQNDPLVDVFARQYAWHVPRPLDVEAMRQAARRLLGRHDFASFQAAGSPRVTTERTIKELDIQHFEQDGFSRIVIEVEADGFLYNMVRNIVGSLVETGLGNQPPAWIDEVVAAKDRRAAGPTAPAHGLFLVRVDYD